MADVRICRGVGADMWWHRSITVTDGECPACSSMALHDAANAALERERDKTKALEKELAEAKREIAQLTRDKSRAEMLWKRNGSRLEETWTEVFKLRDELDALKAEKEEEPPRRKMWCKTCHEPATKNQIGCSDCGEFSSWQWWEYVPEEEEDRRCGTCEFQDMHLNCLPPLTGYADSIIHAIGTGQPMCNHSGETCTAWKPRKEKTDETDD